MQLLITGFKRNKVLRDSPDTFYNDILKGGDNEEIQNL